MSVYVIVKMTFKTESISEVKDILLVSEWEAKVKCLAIIWE